MKLQSIKTIVLGLCMAVALLFTSCSSDDNQPDPQPKFDINNPEGYVIVFKNDNEKAIMLSEFLPKKKLAQYHINTGTTPYYYTYKVEDNKIILLSPGGTIYTFSDNGTVTTDKDHLSSIKLIKKPQTNQLAGKTFKGTYYYSNGNVLHPNFYYAFKPSEYKVDVGLNVGTPLRTNDYDLICNMAAYTKGLPNNEKEFVVLVDGMLESNYSNNNYIQYGSLEEVK